MNLENITKSKITTVIGILFLLADFVHFVMPIWKVDYPVNIIMLITGAFIGLGLLLSPDTLFERLKDKM